MSETSDQYYHQLSSTGSYQSISFMGLSEDEDDDDDKCSDITLEDRTSQDINNETKPLLEKLLPYKEVLLPYKPSTSDDEVASSADQFEFDEFELSPAQLELDELESQYMLQSCQDQFQLSRYQISKSQDRLQELKDQYEEFQDQREEPAGTALVKDIQKSGEIHIDLHRAFLKECRNLDSYFTELEQKEMTKNNVTDMTKYVNKLRDLYMAFLINYIDQKYQIISLQNTVIEKKHSDTTNIHEYNNNIMNISLTDTPSNTPQIKANDAAASSDRQITSTRRLNSRPQHITYTRPYVLILKSTSHIHNTRKIGFKSQKITIENHLELEKNQIGIKSIGPTRQGGVVLSFYSEDERKLAYNILLHRSTEINLLVTIPTIIYPKMVIHDIGNHWNMEELKITLITQNREIEIAYNNGEMFEIVFLSKDGEVIIKVSPSIRYYLKQTGRICTNLESYKVSDRIFIKRCYKCHQFGHFSSACIYNDQKCGHCNESHTLQDCPHKDDETKALCVNCMKSKLHKNKANHRPSDPTCPSLRHEQQKSINKTDYGPYGY